MKKFATGAILTALTLLAATACQQDGGANGTEETNGSGDAEMLIALIGKTTDEHFNLVRAGAIAAGDDLGVTVNYNAPDTSNEGDRQLNMLQTAINNEVDAIGLAPQDGIQDSAPSQIEGAGDIPFVVFDTPLPGSDAPVVTITSNNTGIGAHLAEEMSNAIGGQGKVALITNGIVGTAAERRDGFVEWIEENAPDIEIVTIQDGEADQAKSRDKAQGILQANPDLAAMAGTGNYSTIAIADEVASRGLATLVFGVDADPDVLTQMREGLVHGVVAQNPYEIGYQTVEVLVAAINGEVPDESLVYTESAWITPDNMDDPDIQRILGTE